MSGHDPSLTVQYATPADLESLKNMWHELYEHQSRHGMLLTLPPGAFDAWTRSMAPLLGRFAVVVVGEREGRPVGFVAGRVRALPPYFGSGMVGTISEVFVQAHHRGGGVGRRLLASAVDWFSAQEIARVELQVVAGNPDAVRFYTQLGWHEELVQMVWERGRNT